MSLRQSIEDEWAGKSRAGLAMGLRVGSMAFGAATRVRNALYDARLLPAGKAPIPVISVGNLTVGGTGKTPIVRWVVSVLNAAGHHPAVVLRGYGGDETQLHRRWYPEVPVVDAPARLPGVIQAANAGASVAVCDDAFQHRRLARDLDVVLIDAHDQRPVRLLPAGPYRELPTALARADLVLVVAKGVEPPQPDGVLKRLGIPTLAPPVHSVVLGATGWSTLEGESAGPPQGPALIVTGVGSPASVETLVRGAGVEDVELLAFPDHHPYTESDVQRILKEAAGRPIVTTEKDAVKLLKWNILSDHAAVVEMGVQSVSNRPVLEQGLLSVMES